MGSTRSIPILLGTLSALVACGGDSKTPTDPEPSREWKKIATLNHDGPGAAIATFAGAVVIGGYFEAIDGVPFHRLARWDGSNWTAVSDFAANPVTNLFVHQGRMVTHSCLFVGGGAGCADLAMWDGVSWTTLDIPPSSSFEEVAVEEAAAAAGFLYACGSERNEHFDWYPHVYRWTGTTWEVIPSPYAGTLRYWAQAVGEWNGTLIVSYSESVGGQDWATVARLDGSDWIDLGGEFKSDLDDPYISTFQVYEGSLYAAGYFDQIGDVVAKRVARWNGAAWEAVGNGFIGDSGIRDMVVFDNQLVVAGDFRTADGTIRDVAAWDGASWSAIGQPWMAEVNAVGVFGEHLIATGPDYVAQW